MTTIFAFIFVIGVLVFVHELGHYLAARRIGVRVLKFSLGFGPRLVGFTRGDTEYCISAIPLGGYVKMAGENPDDPRSGQPDEFLSKTKWQRFQVLITGPLMNLVLAVVVLAVVLMQGADVPGVSRSAAGHRQHREELTCREGRLCDRRSDRDRRRYAREDVGGRGYRDRVTPETRDRRQRLARRSRARTAGDHRIGRPIRSGPNRRVPEGASARCDRSPPGQPAAEAGLKPNDIVLAVNGEPVSFARQLSDAIGKAGTHPIVLALERAGQSIEVRVTPRLDGNVGRIGISISNEVRRIEPGFFEAIRMSVQRTWEMSGLILRTLYGLLSGETSPKQLMGPVGIAQLSGESAEEGWLSLLALMASISLNLGSVEPAADSGPGRRTHFHHGARGARAPRLQHPDEGADALRGIPAADAADGDGDLQRPDAHPVGREPDVLAVGVGPCGVGRSAGRALQARPRRPDPPNPRRTGRSRPPAPARCTRSASRSSAPQLHRRFRRHGPDARHRRLLQ